MNYTKKWLDYFFTIATAASQISKDPSTKVGACVVDSHKSILATGYNGFPRGVDDSLDKYQDRAYKLSHVCHAEANCVCQAARTGSSLVGSTLFVTLTPCIECAKLIIQSGITCVIYKVRDTPTSVASVDTNTEWRDKIQASLDMLKEARVEVYEYDNVKNLLTNVHTKSVRAIVSAEF